MYFFIFVIGDISKHADDGLLDYMSLISILLRNLCTFYATSLLTIWQLKKINVEQYHINDNLLSNLNILSLDVVMTH